MFPVPPPKLPSDDSVTGAPQALPVFTAACNPPEGGVKRTAEVPLPLVATAIPKPLAMKCGALQVWAAATPEHVTTQLATSRATDFQDLRTSHISRSFGEGPPQRHSRDALFYRLGPTTLRPASSRESGGNIPGLRNLKWLRDPWTRLQGRGESPCFVRYCLRLDTSNQEM